MDIFSTPLKPFIVPSYARGLAQFFAEALSPVLLCSQSMNARALAFVDVEAKQDDSDASSNLSLEDVLCLSLWIPYIDFRLCFLIYL